MEACDGHAGFIASVMEPIDTRETYGQFVAELLVAQARMESANTSARQRRKAAQLAADGVPVSTGKRCFGYTRNKDSIVADEAALIREAWRARCWRVQACEVFVWIGNAGASSARWGMHGSRIS